MLTPSISAGDQQKLDRDKLELEKLRLEINELKRKDKFKTFLNEPTFSNFVGELNEPIGSTLLTLLVGGFIVSILGSRRSRKNKRLDQAIRFVDEVAVALNPIFTLMFRSIRSSETSPAILPSLAQKVPRLFERRLSITVRAKAYLPNKDRTFTNDYVRLSKELETILRFLERAKFGLSTADDVYEIKSFEASLAKEWPLQNEPTETVHTKRLIEPFIELDKWVEMVWRRANHLLGGTLKDLLQ